MVVLITGFALGIWLSGLHNEAGILFEWYQNDLLTQIDPDLEQNPRDFFGTVIVLLFLLQPLLGLSQHHHYEVSRLKDAGTRPNGMLRQCHVWLGRILIVLGIINGSLGLQLGANTIAGTILVVYVMIVGWWY